MVNGKHAGRGLARPEQWPLYGGGVITEVLYVLALTGAAWLMAVVAEWLWL